MSRKSLKSLSRHSRFLAESLNRSSASHSTVVVWPDSPYTAIAEGEVFYSQGFRLRMREEVDLDAGLIVSHGYEVYQHAVRLYWYDDFPHPNDPDLASTFPHHKHVEPDLKHNRVPAPALSHDRPNLTIILDEIEEMIENSSDARDED